MHRTIRTLLPGDAGEGQGLHHEHRVRRVLGVGGGENEIRLGDIDRQLGAGEEGMAMP
jgi:hypothetical protein